MANDLFFSRDTKLVVKCDSSFFEIPVLDGFSFSQATNSSEVTLSEMESTTGVSRRGRKMFNDSMAPAEWSFSTYARPFLSTVDAVTAPTGLGWDGASASVHAVEEVLWAALVGTAAFTEGTASADAAWDDNLTYNTTADPSFDTTTTERLKIDFLGSNKSALKELEIFFIMGAGTYSAGTHQVYKLSKAVVNSATVDFDIDGIATIAWSGFASNITDESSQPAVTVKEALSATNNFIRNRLTTLAVKNAAGSPFADLYTLTLTGGSISFENNITYLTPDTIGEVNSPIGHVTGTRTIGGSFTCYLSNSLKGSSDLFEDLASATTTVTNDFDLTFHIGGTPPATTIAPHMSINLPNCHLEIPSHAVDDVISVETSFSALPGNITSADEAVIVYKGVAVD